MESTVEMLYDYIRKKYDAIKNRMLYLAVIPERVAKELNISPITVRKNLNRLAKEGRMHLEVRHGSNWIIWMDRESN